MIVRFAALFLVLVTACAPNQGDCDYTAVAEAAVRKEDQSISLDGATIRSIEDFADSKMVIISFADGQRFGGAAVAIHRSDCKAVDVAIGGVWSGE